MKTDNKHAAKARKLASIRERYMARSAALLDTKTRLSREQRDHTHERRQHDEFRRAMSSKLSGVVLQDSWDELIDHILAEIVAAVKVVGHQRPETGDYVVGHQRPETGDYVVGIDIPDLHIRRNISRLDINDFNAFKDASLDGPVHTVRQISVRMFKDSPGPLGRRGRRDEL